MKSDNDNDLMHEELLRQIDANGQLRQLLSYSTAIARGLALILFCAACLSYLSGRAPTQRIQVEINDNSKTVTTTNTRCLLWGCNSETSN